MRAWTLGVVLGLSTVVFGAESTPPAVQKIRARYQAVLERLERAGGAAPFSMEVNPADSSARPSLRISFVAPDGLDADSIDQTLQFARVVETWSNLGPQTAEYLFDEKGELLFHSTVVNSGGGQVESVRMYFEGGALIRVQAGAKSSDTLTAKHQAAAERARKAARRLLGWYRDLRATTVVMP